MKLVKAVLAATIAFSSLLALAQAPASAPPQAAPAPSGRTINLEPKPLPAATPVITLQGLCAGKPAGTAGCATVVTRAEFDHLVTMLSGGRDNPEKLTIPVKRQIATSYSDLLLLGVAGEAAKLDADPESAELFRVARLRAFAELYRNRMQKQALPSPEEVRKQYDADSSKYRQLVLERVIIPVRRTGQQAPDEAALKKLADDLRERATKGAAFKDLQAEAFEKAGMQSPPDTRMTVQADSVPPDQQAILQLKPNEISPVIQSNGGFFLYRLQSEQQIPFDGVKEQIANSMAQKRFQQEIEELRKKYPLDLNSDFFGEALPPGMSMPGMPGPGGMPQGMPPGARRPPMPPSAQPQSIPVAPATK